MREDVDRRIWVRRSKCLPCRISHCLLPAFCLLRRLYSAEVIGSAVTAIVVGALAGEVAEGIDSPYTTVRDWRRRHRGRAPVLAAGFAALAVELGAVAPPFAGQANGRRWRRSAVPGPRPEDDSARPWPACGASGAW